MNFINIDTSFDNNFESVKKYLKDNSYQKIGHIKKDAVGFCVLIKPRKFFECSDFTRPDAKIVFSIKEFEDLKNKIIN